MWSVWHIMHYEQLIQARQRLHNNNAANNRLAWTWREWKPRLLIFYQRTPRIGGPRRLRDLSDRARNHQLPTKFPPYKFVIFKVISNDARGYKQVHSCNYSRKINYYLSACRVIFYCRKYSLNSTSTRVINARLAEKDDYQ